MIVQVGRKHNLNKKFKVLYALTGATLYDMEFTKV